MYAKSPSRFKFTLKDDYEFNYTVIINIMYLDGKLVLQIVDSLILFQAAKFLKDMSVKTAWDILRIYQINTYQRPLDYLVHDIERNFLATKFRQHAKSMAIEIKEVPVKAYNSIGKVKRYYTLL